LKPISYPYKADGVLPDGSKVPDIPVIPMLIVRSDRGGRGLAGDSIVDTGFDAGIYANLDLVEFLEGTRPRKTASLQAAGRSVTCEVFGVECYITDPESKPVVTLGSVEVYCPVDPIDLSEDVIVGRAILNRLRLEMNGRLTKLLAPGLNV
jgi:predicted aspartyl protease